MSTSDRPLVGTLTMKMDCHSAGVALRKLREIYPNPSPGVARIIEGLETSETKDPDVTCTIEISGGPSVWVFVAGLFVLDQH